MPKFKNIENKKNITYELAYNEGNLTIKDKKILTLAKKIEKDKNAVKELKKFSNIQEILMVEIVRKREDQKERFALLQHALLYSHKATLEHIIKEAEQYKLFEKIADKEIISERLDDHGKPISKTYSTVIYEDDTVKRKALKSGVKTTANNGTITDEDENGKKVLNLNTTNQVTSAVNILTETESCESSEEAKNSSSETAMKESKACDMAEDVEEVKDSFEVKEQTNVTETDTKLCNINSEDLQQIFESSEEAQIETTVEPTSVDRETNEQEPNSLSSAEPYFDSRSGNTVDEKSSKKAIQPIVAGVVGTILLASGVALYIMKMPVVAAVVGIAGLVCIGFALYNIINPNTKLEKVKSVEQPLAFFESKDMLENS